MIFYDFLGGVEIFELIVRFCYNKGCIEISFLNFVFFYFVVYYMDMNKFVFGIDNLIEYTEKSFEEISYWIWFDFLLGLKKN